MGLKALREGLNGGVRHIWRAIRRWKWPIAAIIFSILMSYALYWTGPEQYRTYTFGILPIFLTYTLLALCLFVIFAGILYELKTQFRIYYICESCDNNFIFEGRKNPDIRCPFCSSENLRIAEIIALKEHPRGLVWNPPSDLRSSSVEKEFKICPMCGSLEDIASSVCSKCSYKFETRPIKERSPSARLQLQAMNGGTEGTGQSYSSFRSGAAADRAAWVVGILNELCEYLKQIGIGATVVWDDPSPEVIHYQMMPGTFGEIELPLGYVKVEGRSIDTVKLRITLESPWGYGKIDHYPFRPPGSDRRETYYISYFVHGTIENLEDELKAETKPIKGGLLREKVTGFEWKGGRLAGILNADLNLKNMLLRMGLPDLVITPNEKEKHVEITTTTIVADEQTIKKQVFPTPEAFEAYDRIAKHIRSIITYTP